MSSRVRVALSGLLVVIAGAALIPILDGVGGTPDPATGPSTVVSVPGLPRGSDPATATSATSRPLPASSVDPALSSKLRTAASTDANVRVLTAGRAFGVVRRGPWTRKTSQELIGGVIEISLAKPVDSTMRAWPVIVWDDKADTYSRHSLNAQFKNVRSVRINVDLAGNVVAVWPDDSAVVTVGPGNDWTKGLPPSSGD